jgi:hypothetical protein
MRCLVTAGKHINNIQAIARQPPITTIEELLRAVFSVGSAPGLYNEDPRPAQWNWGSSAENRQSSSRAVSESVEGWQFSWALQGRLRRECAIFQVTVEFWTCSCDKRTWARKAEESPLLEAIASEQLVKIQQAGKDLAGAAVICNVESVKAL